MLKPKSFAKFIQALSHLIAAVGLTALVAGGNPALAGTADASFIDGFNKTVFASEYGGGQTRSQLYVRKFNKPVRFYLRIQTAEPIMEHLQQFILSLSSLIKGLDVAITDRPGDANFVVHVVPKSAYARTVRDVVYRDQDAVARGRCMVRAIYNRRGIIRSEAVIVADQGMGQFNRCMIEEILQGLGPLNDHASLSKSMFNDQSRFTTLQPFDRVILNMLYDPAVHAGAAQHTVQPILPSVVRRVRQHMKQLD